MALPGTKAKDLPPENSRLKLLLFGDWKTGKSTAAAQFPRCYFIDCERGAEKRQYRELLVKAEATYYATNSYEEIVAAVRSLLSDAEEHQTLVIDPVSVLYSDLLEVGEKLKGDAWGRHTAYADQAMKRLFLLLDKLDMNLIMTSHAKAEYEGAGQNREATGNLTPDAWKKLPYAFDLILELRRAGELRQCLIRGSRLEEFREGEKFEWSYQEFVKRLGKSTLERLAVNVPMVSEEQLAELTKLLSGVGVTEDQRTKLLAKFKIVTFEDLTSSQADKLLTYLRSKAEAESAKL